MNLGLQMLFGARKRPFVPPPNPTAVAWQSLTANGTSGMVSSTQLTAIFSEDPGLTTANFIVTGASKGVVSKIGAVYTININTITVSDGQSVTLDIINVPTGFIVTPESRDVAVVKVSLNNLVEDPAYINQFTVLPQDSNGWTVIPDPTASSLIMYVAEDGDDTTATPYTIEQVDDWENPSGTILAFKTIQAAREQTRAGEQDYVLLKRGDTIATTSGINARSGKSATERQVYSSYGTPSLPPPRIEVRLTSGGAIISVTSGSKYVIVKGIDFTYPLRSPTSQEFVGWENLTWSNGGVNVTASTDQVSECVLVEGCRFKHSSTALGGQQTNNGIVRDVVFRRNTISETFKGSGGVHPQGIGGDKGSYLIEENVLISCGYYNAEGTTSPPTIFSHSMYMISVNNTIIRNNISIDPSSMHLKFTADTPSEVGVNEIRSENVAQYGNVFLYGSLVSSFGGNISLGGGPRFKQYLFTKNLSQYIGKYGNAQDEVAWGAEAKDCIDCTITDNMFLEIDNPGAYNRYAVAVNSWSENVLVKRNIVRGHGDVDINSLTPGPVESFSNLVDYNDIVFSDPGRKIEDYLAYLGLGSTIDDLKSHLRDQYIIEYNPNLDTRSIIPWFFSGYQVSAPIVLADISSTNQIINNELDVVFDVYYNQEMDFQWYQNNVVMSGQTSRRLHLTDLTSAIDQSTFKCIATKDEYVIESTVMTVSYEARNFITIKDPDSVTIVVDALYSSSLTRLAVNDAVEFMFKSAVTTTDYMTMMNNGGSTNYLRIRPQNGTVEIRGADIGGVSIAVPNIAEVLLDNTPHLISFTRRDIGEPISIEIDGVSYVHPTAVHINNNQTFDIFGFAASTGSSANSQYTAWNLRFKDATDNSTIAFFDMDSGAFTGGTEAASEGMGTLTYNVDEASWTSST